MYKIIILQFVESQYKMLAQRKNAQQDLHATNDQDIQRKRIGSNGRMIASSRGAFRVE